MLTAEQLEKIIELETNLRAEYQSKLDTKSAEIESALKKVADLQATIATQLPSQLAVATSRAGFAGGQYPGAASYCNKVLTRNVLYTLSTT